MCSRPWGWVRFFSGSKAADAAVNSVVTAHPASFALSQNGFGEDTNTAVLLAGFMDRPLESTNGAKLTELYDQLVGGTIEASALSRSIAEGLRIVQDTVRGEQLAITGVDIDEEVVRMIAHQRAFQASARLIATAFDLLEMLINL